MEWLSSIVNTMSITNINPNRNVDNTNHKNHNIHTKMSKSMIAEHNKKWEKNGWINSKNEPVANSEIIRNILDLLNKIRTNFRINIEFKHQLAHKSSPTTNKNLLEYYLWEGNYCVDYLVQKAVIGE